MTSSSVISMKKAKPAERSSVSNIHPDDENFPSGHPSMSNSSRLHQSGRNGKSSSRFSKFEKNPAFKCIRPDDVVILSRRHSVFDKHYSFWLKTQLWEDGCNRPDDVCSRLDAILDKVSCAYIVQPSGRQSSLSGHSKP